MADAVWRVLIQFTAYKAEYAGKKVVFFVDGCRWLHMQVAAPDEARSSLFQWRCSSREEVVPRFPALPEK